MLPCHLSNLLSRLFLTTLTLLVLCHFPASVLSAAVITSNGTSNSSAAEFSIGVSVVVPMPYSETLLSSASLSSSSSDKEDLYSANDRLRAQRKNSRKVPPGADTDPHGVIIYNSLDDVPTARLLWRARRLQKCYSATPRREAQCWTAYVCGHRCEPVLLAVNSFCHLEEPNCDEDKQPLERCGYHGRWIRCTKPRKFKRCFARVCFRRFGISHAGARRAGPRPISYEDPLSISIVRYHRPPPKHEVFARRNRQSSTQSAIFR